MNWKILLFDAVIIGGAIWMFIVVWYLPYMESRKEKTKQVRKRTETNQSQQITIKGGDRFKVVGKIVSDYLAFMESDKFPAVMNIADTNRLPYSKDVIKEAFKCFLLKSRDEEAKKAITGAYYSLADFQDGVGDKEVGINFAELAKKQGVDMDTSPLALREFAQTGTFTAGTRESIINEAKFVSKNYDVERYEALNKLVVAEIEELGKELTVFYKIVDTKSKEQFVQNVNAFLDTSLEKLNKEYSSVT